MAKKAGSYLKISVTHPALNILPVLCHSESIVQMPVRVTSSISSLLSFLTLQLSSFLPESLLTPKFKVNVLRWCGITVQQITIPQQILEFRTIRAHLWQRITRHCLSHRNKILLLDWEWISPFLFSDNRYTMRFFDSYFFM